jgi:hypothetical protein
MHQLFALCALVLAGLLPLGAQAGPDLVGRYQMEGGNGSMLELRQGGAASINDQPTTWSANAQQITIGNESMPYKLQGGKLLMTVGSQQTVWKKLGSDKPGTLSSQIAGGGQKSNAGNAGNAGNGAGNGNWDQGGSMAQGGAQQGGAVAHNGNPQDAQARQMLMSSAWCAFTYNKISGTSTTKRVVFRPDGIMTINGGTETYSSGSGGTVAGQYGNASQMRWKVENLRLLLDQGNGMGFQDINLTAEQNSNGYPILKAAGQEYAQCR